MDGIREDVVTALCQCPLSAWLPDSEAEHVEPDIMDPQGSRDVDSVEQSDDADVEQGLQIDSLVRLFLPASL